MARNTSMAIELAFNYRHRSVVVVVVVVVSLQSIGARRVGGTTNVPSRVVSWSTVWTVWHIWVSGVCERDMVS